MTCKRDSTGVEIVSSVFAVAIFHSMEASISMSSAWSTNLCAVRDSSRSSSALLARYRSSPLVLSISSSNRTLFA